MVGPPYPCFERFRDETTTFEGMAAFSGSNIEVVIDGRREQARGMWLSGNFYDLLGIRPIIGRALSAADDRTIGTGGPDGPVAVISRAYWQQRFGGDPAVVGRTGYGVRSCRHDRRGDAGRSHVTRAGPANRHRAADDAF